MLMVATLGTSSSMSSHRRLLAATWQQEPEGPGAIQPPADGPAPAEHAVCTARRDGGVAIDKKPEPVILPDVATQAHPTGDLTDPASAIEQNVASDAGNSPTKNTESVPKKPAADATE
jgi:hypothetical protein